MRKMRQFFVPNGRTDRHKGKTVYPLFLWSGGIIILAVNHFHPYLYGRKYMYKIRTNHEALPWLMRFKNPEGQLARWIEIPSTYGLTIKYHADAL